MRSFQSHSQKEMDLARRIAQFLKRNSEPETFQIELRLSKDPNTSNQLEQAIRTLLNADFEIQLSKVKQENLTLSLDLPDGEHTSRFFKGLKKLIAEEDYIDDAWLASEENRFDPVPQSSNLMIEASAKTPLVEMHSDEGIGQIVGRSIPENSIEFYKPALDWLDEELSRKVLKRFTLTVALEYFNTSSSYAILQVFKKLEQWYQEGVSVEVIWIYDSEDDDMLEAGEDYQSLLSYSFQLTPNGKDEHPVTNE